MPLLPNLRKHIFTSFIAYLRFAFKHYTPLHNGHANPKIAILRTRKAQSSNFGMRACTPPICNIGNALYRWRFPRLD